MRNMLQRAFIAGVSCFALTASLSGNAQERSLYWGNPDIPVLEQRGFSLGLNMGVADLWSDVGTKSLIDHYSNGYFNDIHGMGGVFIRYSHIPGLAYRLGMSYGTLYATDAWNKKKAGTSEGVDSDYWQRYVRNLDVRSNIWEAQLMAEIAPIRLFSDWEFSRSAQGRFQPYLLLGFSYFHFKPEGSAVDLNTGISKWVDLQPLHTEGQTYNFNGAPKPYNLWSYGAVGGLGVRYEMGRGLAVGLEYLYRYTFTDYIDDASGKYIDPLYHDIANLENPNQALLSQNMSDRSREIIPGYKNQIGAMRGDPNNTDHFSTLSATFFWRIDTRDAKWWNWWSRGKRNNSRVYTQ